MNVLFRICQKEGHIFLCEPQNEATWAPALAGVLVAFLYLQNMHCHHLFVCKHGHLKFILKHQCTITLSVEWANLFHQSLSRRCLHAKKFHPLLDIVVPQIIDKFLPLCNILTNSDETQAGSMSFHTTTTLCLVDLTRKSPTLEPTKKATYRVFSTKPRCLFLPWWVPLPTTHSSSEIILAHTEILPNRLQKCSSILPPFVWSCDWSCFDVTRAPKPPSPKFHSFCRVSVKLHTPTRGPEFGDTEIKKNRPLVWAFCNSDCSKLTWAGRTEQRHWRRLLEIKFIQ